MPRKTKIHRPNQVERIHYLPSKRVEVLLHPQLLYAGELDVSRSGRRNRHSFMWRETRHKHPFLEVLLITGGEGTVAIGSDTYSVHRGNCLVYNQDEIHAEISSSHAPLAAFYFAARNINIGKLGLNKLVEPGVCPVIAVEDDLPMLEKYFSDLVHESRSSEYYAKEMTESLTRMLLILLLRKLNFDNTLHLAQNNLFRIACNFIDEHYTAIHNIDDICQHCKISRFYLMHIFKQYGEKPPLQRIISKRIELACSLLASTDMSTEQVAERCGYEDESYFCRIFQKHKHITPLRYRKTKAWLKEAEDSSSEPQTPCKKS